MAMLITGFCSALQPVDTVEYPDLPDRLGVAGAFMGVSNGVVIVAGGSNFDRPLWAGGTKRWLDDIWVLRKGTDNQYAWAHGGKLPVPVSNGASVTTPQGVVCIGGATATGETDRVFRLDWNITEQRVERTDLPSLPQACAYLSATIVQNRVVVAGGKNAGSPGGMDTCLDLELDRSSLKGWQSFGSPLPVPCFGAVFGLLEKDGEPFLLLASGKHNADYLTDVYRRPLHSADTDWEPLEAMPRAALVAATFTQPDGSLAVFGGSDGVNIENRIALRDDYHLNDTILRFDPHTLSWTPMGRMPVGVVATQALAWQGGILLIGGELGNAMRSGQVWWFDGK